jgi:hypothetical protein
MFCVGKFLPQQHLTAVESVDIVPIELKQPILLLIFLQRNVNNPLAWN